MSSKPELRPRFWERHRLADLTPAEWEALCDGCGKCCLHKLEDEDTGRIYRTNVACRLLDSQTCQCRNYPMRKTLVPDCVQLRPETVRTLTWLPSTCAYRRIDQNLPLPNWHHLITGSKETAHNAGATTRGWTINETEVPDIDHLEDYILDDRA